MTISGDNAVRALFVQGGATLRLPNLTIANEEGANRGGLFFCGGGVLNSGALTATNSTLLR